jgi:hypothetical protein
VERGLVALITEHGIGLVRLKHGERFLTSLDQSDRNGPSAEPLDAAAQAMGLVCEAAGTAA